MSTTNSVTPVEYISWVQRSLNRLLGAGVVTNGKDSQVYRLWVQEFQFCYQCATRSGQVDSPTQDKFITANRWDPIYVKWVQSSLKTAGVDSKLGVSGDFDDKTKDCVYAFQAYNSLKADGWVGAKTETLLLNAGHLMVPGEYRVPVDFPDPVQQHKSKQQGEVLDARSLREWLDARLKIFQQELIDEPRTIGDTVRRTVTKGMIKCLLEPDLYDCSYLSVAAAKDYANGKMLGRSVEQFALNARDTLLAKVWTIRIDASRQAKHAAFKECVKDLYLEIDRGLREIAYQMSNSSGTTVGSKLGSYTMLNNWDDQKRKNPRSIISCFPAGQGKSPL